MTSKINVSWLIFFFIFTTQRFNISQKGKKNKTVASICIIQTLQICFLFRLDGGKTCGEGRRKPSVIVAFFVGRQKLCFAKSKLSITMQSEVRSLSSPRYFLCHPTNVPLSSFLPLASRSFQLFHPAARLLGPPAWRNAASPLIKSSLSVTPLTPSKAGSPLVVVVGGGSVASMLMKRPLKSRPASRLLLMRSTPLIQHSGRAVAGAWNARSPSLATLLRCY